MIALCFGTRPEAIKLAPVADALTDRGVPWCAIASGQHTSLLAGTPAETTFCTAHSLGLPSDDDPTRWGKRAREGFEAALIEWRPRVVVVQGDTMSALAAAEAAVSRPLMVAHVEAGVRSGSLREPWPEERIRRKISQLAAVHYAPTPRAVAALASEGARGRVLLTGNTVVDALRAVGAVGTPAQRDGYLVTLHRRELRLRGDPYRVLREAVEGMHAASPARFLWPVHPAMTRYVPTSLPVNVARCRPLAYVDLLATLRAAKGVLTDSGGLVEEAVTLGVPTAIVRDVNDRVEAEALPFVRRFDRVDIAAAVNWLPFAAPEPLGSGVFGDGHAAERIAADLAETEGLG